MSFKRKKLPFDEWLEVLRARLQKYNKHGLGIFLDTAKPQILIHDCSPASYAKNPDLIRLRPTNLIHHMDSLRSCHATGEVPFSIVVVNEPPE